MGTEQQALKVSLVAILSFSAIGITFGLISGSSAIIFDGVFSLVDAVLSVISIVVSSLIASANAKRLSSRLDRSFTFGFWHFEPMVLAAGGLTMIIVAIYALVQSLLSILSGGRDIEFGPAIVYTVIILILTTSVATWQYFANKRLKSALVALDIKGWIMAGGITAALLVAFIIGLIIDGTELEWFMPYVDPAVLLIVALVLIPVPISTLRTAIKDLALVTPPALRAEVETVASAVVEEQGFISYKAHVAQVGRSQQVELAFIVAADDAERSLQHWDGIRQRVGHRLNEADPNNWITVYFTTRT